MRSAFRGSSLDSSWCAGIPLLLLLLLLRKGWRWTGRRVGCSGCLRSSSGHCSSKFSPECYSRLVHLRPPLHHLLIYLIRLNAQLAMTFSGPAVCRHSENRDTFAASVKLDLLSIWKCSCNNVTSATINLLQLFRDFDQHRSLTSLEDDISSTRRRWGCFR